MVIITRIKYIKCAAALCIAVIIFFLACGIVNSSVKTAVQDEDAVYVPIIMYHEIKTYKTGKDVITPYEFESDLKYLSANNYHTITMTQLIDYVYENAELPENPIILSFDDGYLNTYLYAFPLLQKYQMKIVFSIIGKNTDDFTRIPDDNLDYSHVTWTQLREMVQSGYVEVQNHSYNLHYYTGKRKGCAQNYSESFIKYEQILTEDISRLQELIFYATGQTPNTFTYPYGKYNDKTIEILKKLGFKAALSCDYGINAITTDPEVLYNLKRICRSHNCSVKTILKKLEKN
jgi:peptidoglycan/xylan/chitin deacetylase (PgdA/CDA1 family)